MQDVSSTATRWAIRVAGHVQGVGFRPLVFLLATARGLTGFVYNDDEGVYIEIEGQLSLLEDFVKALYAEQPVLCHIQSLTHEVVDCQGDADFVIAPSPRPQTMGTYVLPDTAPCEDCLRELRNPSDRRHGYAFINCIHCGPRYSVIESMPYDRERTTMAPFKQCETCQDEYDNPGGRRFHAEPNACGDCGPHYTFFESGAQDGKETWACGCADGHLRGDEAIEACRQAVAAGKIVAMKGIGGYHLICDAYNEAAVRLLRERKGRRAKPLALMAGSLELLKGLAYMDEEEERALTSAARPIVLLEGKRWENSQAGDARQDRKNAVDIECDAIATTSKHAVDMARDKNSIASKNKQVSWEALAPGVRCLGCMLPYAPIHELLLGSDDLWVMTSGNRSGEAVLCDDDKALEDLSAIADCFFVHNRAIVGPVDDSVLTFSYSEHGRRVHKGDTLDEQGKVALAQGQENVAPSQGLENVASPRGQEHVVSSQGQSDGTKTPVRRQLMFYRRSRGYAPLPLRLAGDLGKGSDTILAMGADSKSAIALNRGNEIFLSPYIGLLGAEAVTERLAFTVERFQKLFSLSPKAVVVDEHPAYISRQWGLDYAASQAAALHQSLQVYSVQHHEAHIAAVLAEHGEYGPAVGIALDGTGYGDDGKAWGGEVFVTEGLGKGARCDERGHVSFCQRVGHLTPLPLLGQEKAIAEPWRLGLALLLSAYGADRGQWPAIYGQWFDNLPGERDMALSVLSSTFPVAQTTSMARYFEGLASLLGFGLARQFEGDSPMYMEQASYGYEPQIFPVAVTGGQIDVKGFVATLLAEYSRGVDRGQIAADFHGSLAKVLLDVARERGELMGTKTVALGGGCFQNRRLVAELIRQNEAQGERALRLLFSRELPSNDGGLACGQLAMVLATNLC